MYLSRVTIRRDKGLAALGAVIVPENENARLDVAHKLIWTLFGDAPDTRRDFLWREEEPGRFLVLSMRLPENPGLFDIDTRPFAPTVQAGDRLAFRLRVNATVATRNKEGKQQRHDVVMHAIHHHEKGERSEPRKRDLGWIEAEDHTIAPPQSLRSWIERQGERSGFVVDQVQVVSYDKRRVPRGKQKSTSRNIRDDVVFGIADLDGILGVTAPEAFLSALRSGFGRAKAFGCGLMLIKRPIQGG